MCAIKAVFYAQPGSAPPSQPVRDWLLGLPKSEHVEIGGDIQAALLRDLCDTMTHGSLCAMGGMTPAPVLSALEHYPEDFGLSVSDTTHRA